MLGAAAIGGGALFALIGHRSTATAAAGPAAAMTVTSAAPRSVRWSATIEASGAIAPWQEAIIGTQIGGYRLIDVRVNVGDQVKKGQLLAVLDPDLLRADEAQLEATYEQAEANRQRALKLKSTGAISDQEVLQFLTQAKTAAAALDSKRLQLRYTRILAPDDGAISSRAATLGAVMSVGQELFRLIRANRLEWRGELTAAQLAHIETGQRIELTLPDGSNAVAKVRQTAPSLDTQSRLGIVYADLDTGSVARAGMYANGRVMMNDTPALVVPSESVVIRDGRSYVVKLADASATPKVSMQAVTVGRREGSEVEVAGELAANDRVVVKGAGFLNDGDVVRVAGAAVSSAPALASTGN
ncbi:MAG: efflux RND transporter periplasmic adaptor subunit [Gammaproteobacteria bacterium]